MKIDVKRTLQNLGEIMSWECLDVCENVLMRIDEFNSDNQLYDELIDAIDCELVYYEDQWKVVANYISPSQLGTKDFTDILDEFSEDIFSRCIYE